MKDQMKNLLKQLNLKMYMIEIKQDDARKANTLSFSTIFIKSLCQFDVDTAEEENSNANVKVINKEELINFFIILTE